MDIIEQLDTFFSSVSSLEVDPDNQNKVLSLFDAKDLRVVIDRALKWLVDKVFLARLEPISIPFDFSKPISTYSDEIRKSLTD